jgi:predicted nuclease with TOPRIM domain
MEALDTLKQNLQTLLARYSSLQQENTSLREENERQREEVMRTHAELVQLQEQYKALRIAKGLGETPEQRETAKRQLGNIIAQIDRAIEIIKQ